MDVWYKKVSILRAMTTDVIYRSERVKEVKIILVLVSNIELSLAIKFEHIYDDTFRSCQFLMVNFFLL